MKILFLGTLCPHDRFDEIESRSKWFDYPGNFFQNTLIDGLDKFSQVSIITAPNIKRYRGKLLRGSRFSHNGTSDDICLPEFDIPAIKEIISAWNFKKKLKKIKDIDVILVFSTSFPALFAASYLKKKIPHIKIINLITDLPEYMSTGNSWIFTKLKNFGIKLYNNYSKYIDGYILLAPKMIERLPQKNIPWLHVEGLFSYKKDTDAHSERIDKTILYSGALESKYGIIDLLDAFELLNDKDYKLYLCGTGTALETIKQRASKDSRIQYLGVLDRPSVLKLQSEVSLLVNPRSSKDDYTKYSFPSKTMEYMASGTPVLMTKLKCLPEEYYRYLYFIEDETPQGIHDKIIEIMNKPISERWYFGRQASNFILENKNPTVQASRIINFIEHLN